MHPEDDVSRICYNLLVREPFYGHLMASVARQLSSVATETLAVGLRDRTVVLLINSDFWQSLETDRYKVGLIKHELLHLALKHVLRIRHFALPRLFNVAADLVVNQWISRRELPEDVITLDLFPGLEPDQSADHYYEKLRRILESPDPDLAERSLLHRLLARCAGPLIRHVEWNAFGELESGEAAAIADVIDEQIVRARERARGARDVYGTLPAGLRMVLDEMDRLPPNLDWRRVLRLFSSSARRTHLQNTLKRPSARFGTIPGVRVRRRHRLLVAIDTSGSIGQDDYDEFFSELTHLYRTGSEIRVVECDVEIQREYDYRGETPRATRGGGGTAFDAPLRYANREYRPDAIIYLTDGFGPAPETRTRAPLLWLISSGGLTRHALAGSAFRGTKVKMRRGSAR